MKLLLIFFVGILCFSCSETNDEMQETSIESVINNLKSAKEYEKKPAGNRSIDCQYDQLSTQFDIQFKLLSINQDSSNLHVFISDKQSNLVIDSISVKTQWIISPPMYGNCKDVRSYSTGVNVQDAVIDNCPGDLIVADFNFDGLDDFAVAVDNGGNGGYLYSFYLQTRKGRFIQDTFLTANMKRFPVEFNKKKKTLITSVRANASEDCETEYQLNGGTWIEIHRKYVKL